MEFSLLGVFEYPHSVVKIPRGRYKHLEIIFKKNTASVQHLPCLGEESDDFCWCLRWVWRIYTTCKGQWAMEHYKMTLSVELHPLGLDEYLDNIYNYTSNAARLRQKGLWQNTQTVHPKCSSDLVDAYSQWSLRDLLHHHCSVRASHWWHQPIP